MGLHRTASFDATEIAYVVAGQLLGGVGGVGGDLVAEIMDISDATTTDDPSTITDPVALAFRRFADFTGADRLADAPIVITPGDHSGR